MSKLALSDLEKLPSEIVQDFRKTGISEGIPAHIQSYILQLDRSVEIYRYESNISRASRKLMEDFPNLSFTIARTRMYDAINYFHLNNSVKNEAWDQVYADRLDDAAKVALKLQNIAEYRRCILKAHELRTKRDENAIDPEDLKIKDQVISPDISPERLGLKKHSLKDLWVESAEIIEELDIDEKEKEELKREASKAIGINYEGTGQEDISTEV